MKCEEVTPLIQARADGELDLAHTLEVDRHLSGCANCERRAEQLTALRSTIAGSGLRYAAPPQLRERILVALPGSTAPSAPSRSPSWRYVAAAMALAATVLLIGLPLVQVWNRSAIEDRFAQDVISNHVRSLLADHLMDVPSEDRHTVKPWFAGRLDFSPQVADLKDHDFPLAGGRLDVLFGRPIAALVYRHGKHVINLFVFPANTKGSESTRIAAQRITASRDGFNLFGWSDNGLDYVAVSDLNGADLQKFATLVQSAIAEKPPTPQ